MIKSIITRNLLVSFMALSLTACGSGGGGGSNGSTPVAPTLKTGVFLDSAVEGLKYRTATQSGVTEAGGVFRYVEGETITFFMGETVLGQIAAKGQITPVDLVSGASDETNPKVTNICRLLQSLDRDGIPENGIQIPQQALNVLINHPVDLNLSTVEFETSSAVKNLFSELNTAAVFKDQGGRVLCAVDQARTHFRETLNSFVPGTQKPALKTFANALELEAYLKEQYASSVLSNTMYKGNMELQLAGSPAPTSGTASDYSQTNIQEAGVDESDMVKTDGTYLYIAGNRKVIAVKAVPAEAMAKISAVDVKGTVNSLYLYNKILVVLYTPEDGGGKNWLPDPGMGGLRIGMPYWIPVKAQTGIILFDVSNPANPQVKKDVIIDGAFVSSRLTGGKLHVIQQFLPNLPPLKLWYDGTEKDRVDTMAANIKALSSSTLKDLTPSVQINDSQGKSTGATLLVAPGNFYHPEESGGGSTVTVTTFNLNDTSYPSQSVGIAADAQTVYATTGYLYLAATRWNYTPVPLTTDVPVTTEETVIHKFDLNGDKAQSMGSGKVPGSLLNQFSMGEYEDVLRIATTTGSAWGGAPKSSNNVFCLKSGTQGLEVIGKLEKLAAGERIYSARFIGKRGFLVTFVQIDPLFTLDLSDPTAPRVVGMLKVPGYSDYIHPLDENHLIAIGKEVKLENGIAWYQGVQLSMFDITDFAKPKLLHKELIGVRGTSSEALYNQKAFTFWKEKNLLALPIQLYEYQKPPAAASEFGSPTFIGLYGYRVGLEKGFESLGRIRTVTDTANPYYPYYWMRGQFIGDWVYAVQPDSVSSTRIDEIGGTVKRISIDN